MAEITGDLTVKERELKVLKFKALFESPSEKKEPTSGSSVLARSARAAFLGRSVTKTSEDLKKLAIFDGDVPLTRNGTLQGGKTLKHARVNSHFSTALVLDNTELDSAAPRRKTVGFANERG